MSMGAGGRLQGHQARRCGGRTRGDSRQQVPPNGDRLLPCVGCVSLRLP